MSLTIKEALAAKGVSPTEENLVKLKKKWEEYEALKGNLQGAALDDYDIALKNVAGGDHHG
ncbi:hypothetical protein [Halomonas piscis]|uniref:hypothetical protein n=1 Tax=Halomonas piscis TaxID=3031727 RepID=UPI00289A8062|nr:hypothetical protein [Halomonas piscis]